MKATALNDMVAPTERIRGLVWCSCLVRGNSSEWNTHWKWCVGTWWPDIRRGGISDSNAWFIPGIDDAAGVQVVSRSITHFHPLPDDIKDNPNQ